MSITWLIIGYIALAIWIFLLVWQNVEYAKYLKRKEEKRKRLEAARKKRMREFKWPEHIPHPINKEE